ncbi:hypothetical protein HK100_000305 [Physocladia obscura]|uniref:Uncharacterized protein n=1 Tax=Physocladia obscura TaxID=109957 RepID=A0AAD5XCL8_9FUNG|nr:hypothetical protein HK100_000305 [Physocladia obscura]
MQYLRSLINENESCPIPDIRKYASAGNSNKHQQNAVCPSGRCQKQLKPWYAQDSSDDEHECGNRVNGFENDNEWCGGEQNKSQSPCQIMKNNIVDELLEDRERDELQALLIKKLLKPSSTTRNRVGLIQALVSGQNVPPQVVAKLLAEDCVMDHMSKKIIMKLLNDSVNNRHADHIIHDLVLDIPHFPEQSQKNVTRQNFIKDNMTVKHVQKLTAPNASKKIVTPNCISELFETLAEAQEAGFGAFVTPRGIKYGNRSCEQDF